MPAPPKCAQTDSFAWLHHSHSLSGTVSPPAGRLIDRPPACGIGRHRQRRILPPLWPTPSQRGAYGGADWCGPRPANPKFELQAGGFPSSCGTSTGRCLRKFGPWGWWGSSQPEPFLPSAAVSSPGPPSPHQPPINPRF